MANALALPVMRCLVLAVGGLAEKCLSSRSWRSFWSIKGYGIKILWLKYKIQEALPNVKFGVEVDESGDLWLSVIEKCRLVGFLRSGSRALSGVQPFRLV